MLESGLGVETGLDIGFYSLSDDTYQVALSSRFNERNASFSPDSRFVAFDSDETGQREIYVQPYPETTDRWRVSIAGGTGPFWRSDGGELYFVRDDSELIAVSVVASADGSALAFGEPEMLCTIDLKTNSRRQVDTVDGQTFIVNRKVGDVDGTPITLVLNGLDGIR